MILEVQTKQSSFYGNRHRDKATDDDEPVNQTYYQSMIDSEMYPMLYIYNGAEEDGKSISQYILILAGGTIS